MKRIIWQMPDGSVAITIPCALLVDGESEEDYLNRVAAHCKPKDAVRVGDIEESEMPEDRDTRDRWYWDDGIKVREDEDNSSSS